MSPLQPDEAADGSSPAKRPVRQMSRNYVSKSDLVTDALRDLITGGRLAPGTHLRQRVLAEQFEVSYTPVREALKRLESEGLVVSDAHRGASVSRTESEELEENYRILAVLEVLAGSLAMPKLTGEDLIEIEELCRFVADCDPEDPQLTELNRRFHFRIYECARSPMLILLMRLLWRSFPNGAQAGRPHNESVRQHGQLVRALKDRDEDQVTSIIGEHALGSIKYLLQDRQPPAPADCHSREQLPEPSPRLR